MRHTGNGSSRYCTYCMAHGIWNGKVYAPLSIPKDAPISAKQRGKWRNLDPLKLPMRKNDQWKRDATRITMQMDWKLSKDTGIAWLSTFCQLKSIDFPRSFPVDAMHLFYQNIQKRMFDHWRGKFDATRKVLKKKAKISKKGSAKTTAKAKQSV